jgi:hypothetical protein
MKWWMLALTMLSILVRSTDATADGVQEPPSACQLTEAVAAADPPAGIRDLAAPFPKGPWYINPERTVWARIGRAGTVLRSEGTRNQVLWIRPADVPLVVTGRRTDAAASPMRAAFTAAAGGYTSSEIFFPAAGCWEIAAVADANQLTFVVWVAPPLPPSEPVAR